jgi:hypothetical protein
MTSISIFIKKNVLTPGSTPPLLQLNVGYFMHVRARARTHTHAHTQWILTNSDFTNSECVIIWTTVFFCLL